MFRDTLAENSPRHERFDHSAADVANRLMPSLDDYKQYMAQTKLLKAPRCDQPDFVEDPSGVTVPSQKRDHYDKLATEALNEPPKSQDKPASKEEQEIAKKVAELALKYYKSITSPKSDADQEAVNEQLKDIFKKLGPDAAQRVINEVNKGLEGSKLRIGQSTVGEIWVGSRSGNNGRYFPRFKVKEADCEPSV